MQFKPTSRYNATLALSLGFPSGLFKLPNPLPVEEQLDDQGENGPNLPVDPGSFAVFPHVPLHDPRRGSGSQTLV